MNCLYCHKELQKNQTFYCSKECKKFYKSMHKKTEIKVDSIQHTGRGVFSHEGNLQ